MNYELISKRVSYASFVPKITDNFKLIADSHCTFARHCSQSLNMSLCLPH